MVVGGLSNTPGGSPAEFLRITRLRFGGGVGETSSASRQR
jgi:hypothetical protein